MRKTVFGRRRRRISADSRVRETLDELRMRGFVVVHGPEQEDGIVDHLVSGPSGLFLINARGRRYDDEDLHEVRRRAQELFGELRTWVTPVLCLSSRRGRDRARRHERVWVLRRKRIASWICAQRNPVLELERVSGLAERLALTNGSPVVSTILLDRARAEWATSTIESFEQRLFEGDPSI